MSRADASVTFRARWFEPVTRCACIAWVAVAKRSGVPDETLLGVAARIALLGLRVEPKR